MQNFREISGTSALAPRSREAVHLRAHNLRHAPSGSGVVKVGTMLLLAPMLSAFSPPTATRPSPPTATRRALLASSAASLLWRPPAHAASDKNTVSTLKAAAREERIEKGEERELLEEMRKIKLAEEMEEAQLQRLRAAQKNPLALATNKESPKKLRREDLEETKSIEADENELAFVRSEYTEGLAKLRAQKTLVAKDREEVLRSRPTSAIDRLRLKQD